MNKIRTGEIMLIKIIFCDRIKKAKWKDNEFISFQISVTGGGLIPPVTALTQNSQDPEPQFIFRKECLLTDVMFSFSFSIGFCLL